MSCSKHLNMPSYEFPDEILSEILKRLPVKYVLRCRSVQKSWYYLINTPIFIALHFNHHKYIATHYNNDHPKYLFFNNFRDHLLTVRFDDIQCKEYGTLNYPLGLPNHAWYALANGLICVSSMFNDGSLVGPQTRASNYYPNYSRNTITYTPMSVSYRFNRASHYNPNIYLWNPLVQKYKTLPDSPLPSFTSSETCWKALAFGFLPEVNDYVVVHIVKPRSSCTPDPHSVIIGVYSLNTNSWKKFSQDNVFVCGIATNGAVFVNGAAFWTGKKWEERYRNIIMCFDTKTDMLREIRYPEWVANPVIHPFAKSIACFVEKDLYDNHFHMWVLRDDPINGFSWESMISVLQSKDVQAEVLGVRNNGEPILSKFSNLISYNLDNHKEYDFAYSCDCRTPFSYYDEGCKPPFVITPFVETLVLLDID